MENVTLKLLEELQNCKYASYKTVITAKPGKNITKTEKYVLSELDDSEELGYVSNPLLFGEVFKCFKVSGHKAIIKLLHRGLLKVVKISVNGENNYLLMKVKEPEVDTRQCDGCGENHDCETMKCVGHEELCESCYKRATSSTCSWCGNKVNCLLENGACIPCNEEFACKICNDHVNCCECCGICEKESCECPRCVDCNEVDNLNEENLCNQCYQIKMDKKERIEKLKKNTVQDAIKLSEARDGKEEIDIRELAHDLREVAAQFYGCEVKEIDYISCYNLAKQGCTVEKLQEKHEEYKSERCVLYYSGDMFARFSYIDKIDGDVSEVITAQMYRDIIEEFKGKYIKRDLSAKNNCETRIVFDYENGLKAMQFMFRKNADDFIREYEKICKLYKCQVKRDIFQRKTTIGWASDIDVDHQISLIKSTIS